MGKRISEAQYEIEYCAKITEFYANGAEGFLAEHPVEVEDADAYIQHTPIGALLGVMPWNFPFYQVIRFATPNIMAGNTVLMRHASNVPQCAEAIANLFKKCGLPDGVYTNLFVPTEFIDTVIADKNIRGVSLTGSERRARQWHRRPAKISNAPFWNSAATTRSLFSTMRIWIRRIETARQRPDGEYRTVLCCRETIHRGGADREEIYLRDEEVDVEAKNGRSHGRGYRCGTTIIRKRSRRLEKQVTSSIRAGAKALLGGDRPDRKGA